MARLPQRLTTLVRDLDGQGREDLALTPIDVVLSRARGPKQRRTTRRPGWTGTSPSPLRRAYRLYGLLRPDSGAADDELDRLLGVVGDVEATSSSRAFDSPDVRASSAVDGDPFTAWSPGQPVFGSWLELDGAPRRVSHIDVAAGVGHRPTGCRSTSTAGRSPTPCCTRAPTASRSRPRAAARLRLVVTQVTGSGLRADLGGRLRRCPDDPPARSCAQQLRGCGDSGRAAGTDADR